MVEQRLGRAHRRRTGARERAAAELGEYVGALGQQVGLQLLAPRGEPLDRSEHQRRHGSVDVSADQLEERWLDDPAQLQVRLRLEQAWLEARLQVGMGRIRQLREPALLQLCRHQLTRGQAARLRLAHHRLHGRQQPMVIARVGRALAHAALLRLRRRRLEREPPRPLLVPGLLLELPDRVAGALLLPALDRPLVLLGDELAGHFLRPVPRGSEAHEHPRHEVRAAPHEERQLLRRREPLALREHRERVLHRERLPLGARVVGPVGVDARREGLHHLGDGEARRLALDRRRSQRGLGEVPLHERVATERAELELLKAGHPLEVATPRQHEPLEVGQREQVVRAERRGHGGVHRGQDALQRVHGLAHLLGTVLLLLLQQVVELAVVQVRVLAGQELLPGLAEGRQRIWARRAGGSGGWLGPPSS